MKLFGWFEKLISEHGSATALRDHLALVKEKNTTLEQKISGLETALEKCKQENAALQSKINVLEMSIENANKQIKTLESVRVALKDQTQLQNRIRQLETMNADVERQLRIKSIGF
jgi:chromosome segregation ATPase